MTGFFGKIGEALLMAFGMFWDVGWSLVLGFVISGLIQALVSQRRMRELLGKDGIKEQRWPPASALQARVAPTGPPDESGVKRREKGLAKTGNDRVRRSMLQLAWRFLRFQEASALAQWYWARTADARGVTRRTMIVALARKLLIALWRMATNGEIPEGVILRPAA